MVQMLLYDISLKRIGFANIIDISFLNVCKREMFLNLNTTYEIALTLISKCNAVFWVAVIVDIR